MDALLRRSLLAVSVATLIASPTPSLAADTGGGPGTIGAGNSTTGLGRGTTGTGAAAGRPTAPDQDDVGNPGIHPGGDTSTRDTRFTGDGDGKHGGQHGAE